MSRPSSKASLRRPNSSSSSGVYLGEEVELTELNFPNLPLLNVFTFGWMEDGRLGYAPDKPGFIQCTPRPVFALRNKAQKRAGGKMFACKAVSAGSRHTLMLMTNIYPEGGDDDNQDIKRKTTKLLITGLNQRGLCEDTGLMVPTDLNWEADEEPVQLATGSGTCFIVTIRGNVYSFGHGRYGVLGHGSQQTDQVPRQIMALLKQRVTKVSCGAFHAIATTVSNKLYSWGRNHRGQLGRGFESDMEVLPGLVTGFDVREIPMQICCGADHVLALIKITAKDGSFRNVVYAWGDESRGQLGSGDALYRMRPQENRWLTKFVTRNEFVINYIAAGGWHNLAVTSVSGQVVAWAIGALGGLFGIAGGVAWAFTVLNR